MRALSTPLCQTVHRNCSACTFNDFKDTIGGQNLKMGHVTLTTPIRV